MKIKEINIQEDAYNKLTTEIGGVFNRKEWLSIYNEKLKVLGVYDKSNQLIGVFNLYIEKVKGLIHLKTLLTHQLFLWFITTPQKSCKKIFL